MNCHKLQTQLEAYLDQLLDSTQLTLVEAHLAACEVCRMRVQKTQQLRNSLSQLPVIDPDVDFEKRMLSVLESGEKAKPNHNGRQWMWGSFGGAIAAGVMTWSVMLPPAIQPMAATPAAASHLQTVSLKVNEPEPVRLVFTAPKDMENVTVSLTLLNQLELDGFPGQQKIEWTTEFKAGQNVLTLPVIARGTAQGELIARITSDNKSKEFHVLTQPKSTPNFI